MQSLLDSSCPLARTFGSAMAPQQPAARGLPWRRRLNGAWDGGRNNQDALPQVAGHVTATPADVVNQTPRQVDVTDFITAPGTPGATRTLLIFRPLRHPAFGDVPVDDLAASYAKFYSSEAPVAALAPVLTVQYR